MNETPEEFEEMVSKKANLPLRLIGLSLVVVVLITFELFLPPLSLLKRLGVGNAPGGAGLPSEGPLITVLKEVPPPGLKVKARMESKPPTLPQDLVAASPLYRFQAEGDTRLPVRVTLPLNKGVEPRDALDVYTLKDDKWEWITAGSLTPDRNSVAADFPELYPNLLVVQVAPKARLVSGWLPQGSVDSLAADTVTVLNPLWYMVKADGSISGSPGQVAKSGKYQIFPTIQNKSGAKFEGSILNAILASKDARDKHVQSIATLAKQNDYKGIDIDYRDIDPKLRGEFTQLITNMAERLHSDGRSLSLRLPLPEKTAQGWNSGAFDWEKLGKVVDNLKIAAEDDQSLYDKRMSEVLAYATSQIERRKIQMEVKTSSHEKSKAGIASISLIEALGLAAKTEVGLPLRLVAGEKVNFSAPNLLGEKGASGLFWNDETNTVTFVYLGKEGSNVVWIENAFSIAFKLELARRFNLGGVAIENVADDPALPNIWSIGHTFKEKGTVGLVKPNEGFLAARWQSSDGSLSEQAKASVNWVVPNRPGEYAVTLTVSDGITRVGNRIPMQVGATAALPPTPIATPQPLPSPTPIPSPTSVPTPTATKSPTPQPEPTATTPPEATPTPISTPTPIPTPTAEPTSTPTPVPTSPPSYVKYPGVGYGMCIDPSNDFNGSLGMLKKAGFNWAKIQIRWEDLEPQKGNINWGFIDPIVATAQAQGVRLLFSVVTAPRWSRPANTDWSVPGPPANYQDYADFVGAIASRHRGKVHAYEIWNEQNQWYEWGGKNKQNAAEYVNLLKAAYTRIKGIDPDAVVLAGALTPAGDVDIGGLLARDDRDYFREMYAAGMKGYFDAVAVHPSGFNNPPDDDPSRKTTSTTTFKGHWSFYYRNFENYHNIMAEFGDGGKQLWFTEFGWASLSDPYPEYAYARENSEQDQANYLVRAFEIAKARGYVGVMMVWNLNYAPIAEPNDRYAKRAFSIIRPDWTARPAYNALAAMPK